MAGNTEMIDSIVSQSALDSLKTLNSALNLSASEMEKVLIKVQSISIELSKPAKSYAELIKVIELYNKTEVENNRITQEQVTILKQKEEVIKKEVAARKENTQVMLGDLKVSKQVNTLIKETLGNRANNIQSLAIEKAELQAVSKAIKELNKVKTTDRKSYSEAIEKRAQLIDREIKLKQSISEVQTVLKNEQKILGTASGTAENHRLTLEKLRMAYRKLTDEQKSTAEGQELFATINEFDAAVKSSSESIGNFQESVGNYAKGSKDLGRIISLVNPQLGAYVSRVQSITGVTALWAKANRTLANTLNISAKASRALMLTGIGALIAAVAALVLVYKKIKQEQEEVNRLNNIYATSLQEATAAGKKNASEEITRLNLLYKATQNLNKPQSERVAAAKELKKLYPDYLGNLTEEEILAGKGAAAYDKLSKSILATSLARATQDKIIENYNKILALEEESIEDQNAIDENIDKLMGGKLNTFEVWWSPIKNKKLRKAIEERETEVEKLKESNKRLAEGLDISSLLGGSDESLDKEKLKNVQQINLQNIKDHIYAQQKIAGDERNSYDKRIEAYKKMGELKKQLTNLTSKYQIENEKLTGDAVVLVNAVAKAEKIKINDDTNKQILQINKQRRDEEVKQYELEIKDAQETAKAIIEAFEKQNVADTQASLLTRSEQFAKEVEAARGNAKEIKDIQENYQKDREKIIYEGSQKAFKYEIEYLENLLSQYNLNAEAQGEIKKVLEEAKMKYAKEAADYQIKQNERVTQDDKDNLNDAETRLNDAATRLAEFLNDERVKAIMYAFEQATDIANRYYDNELARIDEVEKRQKEAYDAQLKNLEENIEAGLISEEVGSARKRILEATQLENEKKIEEQRKEIQLRQARWEKANAVVQATISTAKAVASALGAGPIIGPILAGIIGALGAAQIAMITAQQIPAYKEGTDNHKGGLAIVGDGGRSEMIITPQGQIYKTPSIPALVNLPKGTEVLPDFKKAYASVMVKNIANESGKQHEILIHDEILRSNTKNTNRQLLKIQSNISGIMRLKRKEIRISDISNKNINWN